MIQPWTFIRKNSLNPFQANVIKYVCRYLFKGKTIEDIDKIIHYIQSYTNAKIIVSSKTVEFPDIKKIVIKMKKEDLKNFNLDNYVYEKSLSSEEDFVFLRRGQ